MPPIYAVDIWVLDFPASGDVAIRYCPHPSKIEDFCHLPPGGKALVGESLSVNYSATPAGGLVGQDREPSPVFEMSTCLDSFVFTISFTFDTSCVASR